jgi:hypothetical protein
MEGSCSTGQSPQRAAVSVEEEEEEEEEEKKKKKKKKKYTKSAHNAAGICDFS